MTVSDLRARVRALAANFTTAQLVTLGVTFVLVVAIVAGSAFWLHTPSYQLLFSDMDAESAAQVVERLKALEVPYQLDPGGRSVRVQSDRIDELRLELTAQGLPASGRVGFEIFDRTAFGATEFLEHVNYRRALEGEIARTIATLAEVSGARVHISMEKSTLFGEPRPAKASVVLKLRGQRPLATSTVAGIANLVAASVEGLRPEAVVILDSTGRPLSRPAGESDDPLGGAQLERQQRMERDLAARVVALLEPVVGADRVRVNVAVTLDPKTLEETEERWDPEAVVRSRQTQTDVTTGGTAPLVVAGARGNLPVTPNGTTTAGAPGVVATAPGSSRQSETTTYEVSRITRHVVQPRGDIARLSVAVILDDNQTLQPDGGGGTRVVRAPRTREELDRLHALVAAAVGLDPERGDQLTVENLSFEEPIIEPAPPPALVERLAPQIERYGRVAVPLIVAVCALVFVVRPVMRRMGLLPGTADRTAAGASESPLPVVTTEQARTVAELENEIEAELDAAAQQKIQEWRKMPVLTRRISTFSKDDPEQVARLLRSWMTDEAR